MKYINKLNLKFLINFVISIVIKKDFERFIINSKKILNIDYLNVQNQDQEDPHAPLLIISNHRSLIDSILIMIFLYEKGLLWENYGISKKTFLTDMFWKAAEKPPKNINIFFIGEQNIITSMIEVLNLNKVVLLFPEGTRNKTNEWLLPFRSGADRILEGTKANILMFRLDGTTEIFEKGKKEIQVKYCFIENKDIDGKLETIYRQKFQE